MTCHPFLGWNNLLKTYLEPGMGSVAPVMVILMESPSFTWSRGHPLAWDFTCPDTFAMSHVSLASQDPGAVAANAKSKKSSTYSSLQNTTWLCSSGS